MKIGDRVDVIGFGRWNKSRSQSRGYRGIESLRGTVMQVWPHKVSVLVGAMTLIFRLSDGHEINYDGRRVSGFRVAEIINQGGLDEDCPIMVRRDDGDCSGGTERPAGQSFDEDCGTIG